MSYRVDREKNLTTMLKTILPSLLWAANTSCWKKKPQ